MTEQLSTGPVATESATVETTEPANPLLQKPESQTPKPEDEFAQRFALLTRKERELREQNARIRSQQERLRQFEESERLAKDDPLAFLERFGLSYDSITERLLQNPDKSDPVSRKLSDLERKLAEREERDARAAQEAEQNRHRELMTRALQEVERIVENDPDSFELIKAKGEYQTVIDVQREYFEKHEKWVDFETAAKWVEEHLEKEAEKLLELKKIKSRWESKAQPPTTPPPPGADAVKPGLTANMAPRTVPQVPGPVSDDELMARALQSFRAAKVR